MQNQLQQWAMPGVIVALGVCMLGLYERSHAQPPSANQPFANPVEQQLEIINQLKTLNSLVKEQNALLRSGTVQVIVTEKKK
jgi:hypothetical protein